MLESQSDRSLNNKSRNVQIWVYLNRPMDFEKMLCVATVKLLNKILGKHFKNKVIYFEEIVVFGSVRIFFTNTHIYKCEYL